MTLELKVPEVGESITQVEIGEWLKSEGEAVEKDEAVATLESEKATLELPAPAAGVMARIRKRPGETAKVGEVIGEIDERGEATTAPEEPRRPGRRHGAAAREREAPVSPTLGPAAPGGPIKPQGQAGVGLGPAARRLLRERGLSPEEIEAVPSAPAKGPAVEHKAEPKEERERSVRMTPLRRAIARRLVEAQRSAALLTTFNEIDCSAVRELRQECGEAFQKRHGVRLGLMSFFVKAAVAALKRMPQLNAEIRGEELVFKSHYDIGIAVGTEWGLVVPVLRDADRLGFADIERRIAELAARARERRLEPAELEGGTFTITNGGVFGSLLSTPIINPPQSGVLGMHAVQDRPVARDGSVAIRPMMYAALTYDHRAADGREAVLFLRMVREAVENPARLLLEI